MTSSRVTVSLPDDVAAHLATLPARQVSAYVAEAVRRRAAGDTIRAALGAAGHGDYAFDLAASSERLAGPAISDDLVTRARERWAAEVARPLPTPTAPQ